MDSAHRRGSAVVLATLLAAALVLTSLTALGISAAAHEEPPCPPIGEIEDPSFTERTDGGVLEDSQKPYREVVDITFPVEAGGYFRDDYHDSRGSGTRVHRGTDVYHREGAEVYAAVGGVVGGWMPGHHPPHPTVGGGYTIQIHGDDGRLYVYAHLGGKDASPEQAYAPGLRPGERVERGEWIGWLGDSGNASAPHLHFEIRDQSLGDPYGSDRLNPAPSLADAVERGDHAPAVDRLAGEDPVETSLLAGQRTFAEAEEVVLVGSTSTAEALSALPLAAHRDAPVLMTDAGALDERVAEEIARLGATSVTLVGGVDALAKDVEEDLDAFLQEHLLVRAEAEVATAEGKLTAAQEALADASGKRADAEADIAAVEAADAEVDEAADRLAAAEDEAAEKEAAEDEAAEDEAPEKEAAEDEDEASSEDSEDSEEELEAEAADEQADEDEAADEDAREHDVDEAQQALEAAREQAADAEQARDDAAERLPALERKTAQAEESVAEAEEVLSTARQRLSTVAEDPGAASEEAVSRLAGDQPADTAATVAGLLWAAQSDEQDDEDDRTAGCAVLAVDPDSAAGWHDAVTAAYYGAAIGAPVLFTGPEGLPEASAQALAGAEQAVLVGSAGAVPDTAGADIAEQLAGEASEQEAADDADDAPVRKIEGSDRRDTALATADALAKAAAANDADESDSGTRPAAWAEGRHPAAERTHRLWVAADKSFADALVAASAAAATTETLVLVGGAETLEPEAADWLDRHGARVSAGRIVGDAHAVDDEVLQELETLLR